MRNIFILLLVLSTTYLSAQDFNTAIGARLGSPLSVSLKKFITEPIALEAYGGFSRHSASANFFNVNAAVLWHSDIESVDQLQYYYGGGGGLYFWSYRNNFTPIDDIGSISIGVHGYIGLSYTFEEAPVNLSVDWSPTIFLNGFGSGYGFGYGAVAVRYVLAQEVR